ncbi:MAG: hypothetical protein V2J12_08195 [Gammaproteobacteria bacterium]|nr:hypothetical protein [Gammaproteobacteria bacterium]
MALWLVGQPAVADANPHTDFAIEAERGFGDGADEQGVDSSADADDSPHAGGPVAALQVAAQPAGIPVGLPAARVCGAVPFRTPAVRAPPLYS